MPNTSKLFLSVCVTEILPGSSFSLNYMLYILDLIQRTFFNRKTFWDFTSHKNLEFFVRICRAGITESYFKVSLWTADQLSDSLPAHFYQNSDKWIDYYFFFFFLIPFDFWKTGNYLVFVLCYVLLTMDLFGFLMLFLENRRCQTQTRFYNNAVT